MNMLEQYIRPGWTIRPQTLKEESSFGKLSKADWLASVKRGYYMA